MRDIILPADEVPQKYWLDLPYTFNGNDKTVCATLDIKAMDIIKRVYNTNAKAPTLTCDGGGGHRQKKIYQNGKCRKLTPVEYERLQTMPDNYTKAVSDSRRYSAIGNGWTAAVVIHLLRGALKNIDRREKLVVVSMYDGIATGRYCFEQLGFTNVEYYAFEIDQYAMAVANDNYPDIIQCGDAFQMRDESFTLGGLLTAEKQR